MATAASPPAFAQASRSDDLFHEGKALMEAGHVAEACQKFADSASLLRRGGTLLNLAVCRETEGRSAVAFRLFVEAGEVALKEDRADRVKLAEDHLQALRSRVSWLTLRPGPGPVPRDLAMTCDEESVTGGAWGMPRAVDPGVHVIRAAAPGRVPFQIAVVVGPPGDHRTVEIPALAEERAADRPGVGASTDGLAPRAAGASPWSRPLAWTALGAGVASAALGSVFGVEAIANNNMSKSECLSINVCSGLGAQKNQLARTYATAADIAIPAGLVTAAAGLYLLLTSRSATAAPSQGASGAASVSRGWVPRLRATDFTAWVMAGSARFSFQSTW
ncbi:MAG TPA: hypothetical protein VGL81_15075 [Polyangiaceae bacterium]|jgi:hypothetical protein